MKIFQHACHMHMVTIIMLIAMVSGCTKITDWGKKNFKQAPVHAQQFIKSAQQFIKTVQIYHELTTVATFDIMMLSDQMRMLEVSYYKKIHGLSPEQEATMRQRQLNENRYFVSFYVIGRQKEFIYGSPKALFTGEHLMTTELLGHKDAMWNIGLIAGGIKVYPESIRKIDIPTTYQFLFGSKVNQFTTVYIVRFAAQDLMDRGVLVNNKRTNMTIELTSPLYQSHTTFKDAMYYGL